MQVLYDTLETFGHHSLGKINEDCGVLFSEQQYTHRSCSISLFKCKYFDQSDPPGWSQILDIYSVVSLQSMSIHLSSIIYVCFCACPAYYLESLENLVILFWEIEKIV